MRQVHDIAYQPDDDYAHDALEGHALAAVEIRSADNGTGNRDHRIVAGRSNRRG